MLRCALDLVHSGASPVASSPLVQNFNAGVSSPGLQDVPEGTGLGEQTGRALGLGF